MSDLVPYSIQGTNIQFNPTASFEEWEQSLGGLLGLVKWGQKFLAKAYKFGVVKWGEEKASQAVEAMGYSPKTLQNALSVFERVPHWEDSLSFDHHASVAKLSANEQKEYLLQAVNEGLTSSELRNRIRGTEESSDSADEFFLKKAKKLLEYLRMHDPKDSSRNREWGIVLAELEGFSRRLDPGE